MEQLLPLRQLESVVGFRKSKIYQLIESGEFPPPIKIGRSSRWPSSEISDWVQETIQRGRSAELTKEVA
jgi:prophage regulatory protein